MTVIVDRKVTVNCTVIVGKKVAVNRTVIVDRKVAVKTTIIDTELPMENTSHDDHEFNQ